MTTVPETREDRAADLFERRAEWLPVQAHDGRTGLALPSQRKPGLRNTNFRCDIQNPWHSDCDSD